MGFQCEKLLMVMGLAAFHVTVVWGQAPPQTFELTDPKGYSVHLRLMTMGTSVQSYTCHPTPGITPSYAWSGPEPDAILTDREHTMVVHHYKGPTWESTAGGSVRGTAAKHFTAPTSEAIDWLEVTASGGTGLFANVGFIHRTETAGGKPPKEGCDAAHAGQTVRVPYSATYVFYVPVATK